MAASTAKRIRIFIDLIMRGPEIGKAIICKVCKSLTHLQIKCNHLQLHVHSVPITTKVVSWRYVLDTTF